MPPGADHGVLDEVGREPVEVVGDALDHDRLGRVDGDGVVLRECAGLARGLTRHGGEVDGRLRRLAAGVRPGQQQQVRHQPTHAARGAQRRGGHLPLFAVEIGFEQLQVRKDARQRAQLVRRVRDEGALAVERRLGLAAAAPSSRSMSSSV